MFSEPLPSLPVSTTYYYGLSVWSSDSLTEKASGLHEPTAEPDSKNVEESHNNPRLPSTLVRIPAEPREKTGE